MAYTQDPATDIWDGAPGDPDWYTNLDQLNWDTVKTLLNKVGGVLGVKVGAGGSGTRGTGATVAGPYTIITGADGNFRVTPDGNGVSIFDSSVGIGTASPDRDLHLIGMQRIERPAGEAQAFVELAEGETVQGSLGLDDANNLALMIGATTEPGLSLSSAGIVDIPKAGAYLALQGARVLSSYGVSNIMVKGGNETLTGTNNVCVGHNNGISLTTGLQNTFVGSRAGQLCEDGSGNVGVGYLALQDLVAGDNNTAVGVHAGKNVTSGSYNTLIGRLCGSEITTASYNTAIGQSALEKCTVGTLNTAVGDQALEETTASYGTAIGANALGVATSGDQNVAVGRNAGVSVTTGANNTLIGTQAGTNITTGSNNIAIGIFVNPDSGTASNQLNIGDLLKGDLSAGHLQVLSELQVGVATGGFKGAGTINTAGDIYKNNSAFTHPDYVFEHAYTGTIKQFIDNDGAKNYPGLRPLAELEAYTRTYYHFPLIPRQSSGMFARADQLLAITEELFLYIAQLHHRVEELEGHHESAH